MITNLPKTTLTKGGICIIMIMTMNFNALSPFSANRFLLVSRLMSSAINKAMIYTQKTRTTQYLQNTGILTHEAFSELIDTYKDAAKGDITHLHTVILRWEGMMLDEACEKISNLVRANDYLGQHPEDDKCLYLLMSNTNAREAQFVYKRLEGAGLTVQEVEL